LRDDEKQMARVCPECGNMIFPRIDPCIIVLVYRDGKILLAKHVQRNQDIFACIAGFVEAGETVENAVEREIWEETHLRVTNVRYFGSQSWPFPAQLMLAFTADYAGGDIQLQADEIADARWFDPNDCPASPQPGSIAYRLIAAARR
jgi:NAD+ diphosphatase